MNDARERRAKRFATLAARMAEAFAKVPEKKGMAEIDRAVAAERAKLKKRSAKCSKA